MVAVTLAMYMIDGHGLHIASLSATLHQRTELHDLIAGVYKTELKGTATPPPPPAAAAAAAAAAVAARALRNDGAGAPATPGTLRNDGKTQDPCFLNARN